MLRIPILTLALAGLLAGCSSNNKSEAPEQTRSKVAAVIMAPPPTSAPIESASEATDDEEIQANADAVADGSVPPPPPPPSAPAAAPTPRQLIYRADLDIKVADLPRAAARVDSIVRGTGSWVGASTQSRADEEWRQEMTIRVQPARFAGLLSGLSGLGTVERKSLSTDDVTAEHADIAARLRTKRALELRYLGLLKQARKVSEILEIEQKIGEVREQIESTESRFKALNDQVAYSTITLKLYQPLTLPTPDAPVISFTSRVTEAFYGGWELITNLTIGLLYLWPLWLLLLAGLLALRAWRRRHRRPAAEA